MLFIRHNKLVPPFHDYSTLTLEQLDQLATGEISPDIQALTENLPFTPTVLGRLKDADFFICSSSLRTQQTCRAIAKNLNISKDFQIDKNLNEIFFRPSQMSKEQDEAPLTIVRKNLYGSILSKKPCVETMDSLQERIDAVMEEYQGKNVVFFTHGFLIRLIKSYSRQKQDMKNALLFIDDIAPVEYLESVVL